MLLQAHRRINGGGGNYRVLPGGGRLRGFGAAGRRVCTTLPCQSESVRHFASANTNVNKNRYASDAIYVYAIINQKQRGRVALGSHAEQNPPKSFAHIPQTRAAR